MVYIPCIHRYIDLHTCHIRHKVRTRMSVICKLRLTESEGPESLLLVNKLKKFREGLHGVGYQLLRLIVIIP